MDIHNSAESLVVGPLSLRPLVVAGTLPHVSAGRPRQKIDE